jgi:hypothetical protein
MQRFCNSHPAIIPISIGPLKMNNISFLLGSGFSVPAGYPTTTELNKRLRKIDASEIRIDNDGFARFLCDGEVDRNADWTNETKKKFVQEFLEFYSLCLQASGKDFHYETFYDYYSDALDSRNYELLASFPDDFRRKHSVDKDNDYLLLHFHYAFSHLIAWELRDRHEHKCDYSAFLHLAKNLGKKHRIHFHSLNHDLYMERLAYSGSIWGEMDDGFGDLGSPYFKRMPNKKGEWLSRFVDKFESRFCLYKLHGSIDQFWIMHNGRHDWIKLRKGMNRWRILKEVEEHGVWGYVGQPVDVVPDFLAGTKWKVKQSTKTVYYINMFNHFENNLRSSNTLIVIGYGFGDSKINEYIEEHFLTDDSKTLFIVDVKPPAAAEKFLGRDSSFYLPGGVTEMDVEFILNDMNP